MSLTVACWDCIVRHNVGRVENSFHFVNLDLSQVEALDML